MRGYTERGFRDEGQDGGKHMDLDEVERLDVENDMIPGCYFFDIGVDGLGVSSLWICADYCIITTLGSRGDSCERYQV